MTNRRKVPPKGGQQKGGPDKAVQAQIQRSMDAAEGAASVAHEIIQGGVEPEIQDASHVDSIVRTIARRISATQARLTGGSTLETMARLTQDSLLNTPLDVGRDGNDGVKAGDGVKKLKDALDQVDASMINDIFFSEKGRFEDYQTYQQVYELITQASEAVQTYCDNIVSPDDFSKRDIAATYEGPGSENNETADEVRKRCNALTQKYSLDDKIEDAIVKSLTKGDFFMAIFNLRQELEALTASGGSTRVLAEGWRPQGGVISLQEVPSPEDEEMKALIEDVQAELGDKETVDTGNLRSELATYMNDIVVIGEAGATEVGKLNAAAFEFGKDLTRARQRGQKPGQGDAKQAAILPEVRGSVVKMIPPENVIKLYQDDTLFGYYYIETIGMSIADFAKRGSSDQSAVVRAIDQNLSAKLLGTSPDTIATARDRLISRVIAKTLAQKLGDAKFLTKNQQFADDAYTVLRRARKENKRVQITYVAPDQMVHFSPNGAAGYGDSVLSRVKFLSKLYLGAMTNAFMRNSIRRPERLVWYIDVGVDNDANNAIQNFIRTIKQREVKFSHLRDITTTINHIGEFHDFYVPTYNGERPVEVETLNMGNAAEVDSPYLDYLRKGIIAGMGVPAAFVGYSEEVAFARSLTMDNGRFLRRVVRHQKHYGKAASRVYQILYRNEYMSLDELTGAAKKADDQPDAKKPAKGKEADKADKTDAAADAENRMDSVEISQIFVRFPSPATLNLTNMSDAINQAQPVSDFLVETVAVGESDDTKGAFKKRVMRDLMPQVHWDRYEKMLEEAKVEAERKKVNPPSDGSATA